MYKFKLKNLYIGFPGGLVVEKLSCNAREIVFIPGLGKFHMPWGNKAHAPELLNHTLEPNKRSHCNGLRPKKLMLLNCDAGEDFEIPLDCKEIKQVDPKGNQS